MTGINFLKKGFRKVFTPLEHFMRKYKKNAEKSVKKRMFIKNARFRTGFTIVEIIVAVFIVGILAAITLPRFGGGDLLLKMQLRTAVHQFATDLRYARRLAVTNSQDYTFRFNADKTYDIIQDDTSIGGDFPKTIPADISISPTSGEVTFQRLGNADAYNSWSMTVADSGYDIEVIPATGIVITTRQ